MRQQRNPNHVNNNFWKIEPFEELAEYWIGHPQSGEVIELEDDEEVVTSSLLGPNGQRIQYHLPSTKQGFIGFVDPETYEDHRASSRRKRSRKPRSKK